MKWSCFVQFTTKSTQKHTFLECVLLWCNCLKVLIYTYKEYRVFKSFQFLTPYLIEKSGFRIQNCGLDFMQISVSLKTENTLKTELQNKTQENYNYIVFF